LRKNCAVFISFAALSIYLIHIIVFAVALQQVPLKRSRRL